MTEPRTGAERYLAGRLADPEYREAYEGVRVAGDELALARLGDGVIRALVARTNGEADVIAVTTDKFWGGDCTVELGEPGLTFFSFGVTADQARYLVRDLGVYGPLELRSPA